MSHESSANPVPSQERLYSRTESYFYQSADRSSLAQVTLTSLLVGFSLFFPFPFHFHFIHLRRVALEQVDELSYFAISTTKYIKAVYVYNFL